jgi:hypothetical protein
VRIDGRPVLQVGIRGADGCISVRRKKTTRGRLGYVGCRGPVGPLFFFFFFLIASFLIFATEF